MMSARRALVGALVLLLLVGGLAAVACARWTRPIADGDEALSAGDQARARAAYAIAEARFDRVPVLRQILTRDYARAVAGHLWLDYPLDGNDWGIGESH